MLSSRMVFLLGTILVIPGSEIWEFPKIRVPQNGW